MPFRELKEPVPTTNDRTAFYSVTDVMQSLGIRHWKFDSIVLHCSDAGKFQKYAVFLAGEKQQAVLMYYDTAQSKFWSDGMYHTYDFDASIVTSAVNAHIANEKFKFYISHK